MAKGLAGIAASSNEEAVDIKQAMEGFPKAKERVAEFDANAELDRKIKEAELKVKLLELQEREANLQDLTERLAERQLKRENKEMKAKTNGATIIQNANDTKKAQNRCNHRKGGNGAQGVVGGRGDSTESCVNKHTFSNGDVWVICFRCGKTWKPVMRHWFDTEEEYLKAYVEYETALNLQTRNQPSGSCQFRFSDNGAYFREVTRYVTLKV